MLDWKVKDALVLVIHLLVLVFIAVVIAFYVVGYVVVFWTFQVNALWGVIALVVWLLIIRLMGSSKNA